jgi:hypothetical protein
MATVLHRVVAGESHYSTIKKKAYNIHIPTVISVAQVRGGILDSLIAAENL